MEEKNFKSGFAGLIGRTNVGKSTMVNKILKQNVVITSDKPQTTRNRINCILNTENAQIVFVDCPGFFKPRNLLGDKLNRIIYGVLNDVDLIIVMTDIAGGIGTGDRFVFSKIKSKKQPKLLLLNKIDLISKKERGGIASKLQELKDSFVFFDYILPISAKTGENLDDLLQILLKELPEGPMYFPDDMVTDFPIHKMIAEIVREKLSQNLFQEIPHSIFVEVESMKEKKDRSGLPLMNIECSIHIEKKSQKGIIIGKSGEMLKKIGTLARADIEELLEKRVFLQIWVKIVENWTKNESYLTRMGY